MYYAVLISVKIESLLLESRQDVKGLCLRWRYRGRNEGARVDVSKAGFVTERSHRVDDHSVFRIGRCRKQTQCRGGADHLKGRK